MGRLGREIHRHQGGPYGERRRKHTETDFDVPQRTEFEAGGSGDPAFASHKHDLIIKPYMPKVNDLVLVLYFPVFNGDGVILGGVKPWR